MKNKYIRNSGWAVVTSVVMMTGLLVTASAETRDFNCGFLAHHNQAEVAMALSYARNAVGASEANKLYSHYTALKNECRSNPAAHHTVNISEDMVSLISAR
jgi:hypothetical protein